jgi:dCMP deaminase
MKKDRLYAQHRAAAGRLLDEVIKDKDFNNVLNMVKTSTVIGYTFTECYDEVKENYPTIKPEFVVAVYMLHKGETPKKIDPYSITDDPVDSWDEYYFNVCRQAARNSKCLSRRIGAILVNKNKGIFATGYNGPPTGIVRCDQRDDLGDGLEEGVCPRRTLGFNSGEGLQICIAAHAEANCINMCARDGLVAEGATMYMTCGVPCKICMITIIQAKIKELVLTSMDAYDDESVWLLKNSNIKVRLYDFI